MLNYSFARTTRHHAQFSDYLALTKPKVVLMLSLTAIVGMALAQPSWQQLPQLIHGFLGITLLSASAAAFNHVLDRRIDGLMARTKNRPLAKHRLAPAQATSFAFALLVIGFTQLYIAVNPLTAWLTLAGLVGYAVIYTQYLKRATPQNIVIGGLAGALPPLLGWTSVTGEIHPYPLLLVMIIFTWTPPHFWALAIHRKKDYAKAGLPMLPVTHGNEFTKTMMLLYTALLMAVGVLPYLVGMSGLFYLVTSAGLNAAFFHYAWRLKYHPQEDTAWRMFKFSVWHILLTFVVLLVDMAVLSYFGF